MAHSPARTGTVSVRLRRALVRIAAHPAVRRLLVVAGLAFAGWLFGGTAQASADTVTDLGGAVAAAPTEIRGVGASPPNVVREARTVVRDALTRRGLPGGAVEVVPGRKAAPRAAWTPRHRAGATSGASKVADAVVRVGGGRVGSPTADAGLASDAGSPRVQGLQSSWPVETDVLLPAGGTAFGGAAGGFSGGGFTEVGGPDEGRRSMLVAALSDVAPAVRTAADEPSFAPD